MSSNTNLVEDLGQKVLPPLICNNPRKRIDPEQIDSNDINTSKKKSRKRTDGILVNFPVAKPPSPKPKFPLTILWNPGHLLFQLNEDEVVKTLSIWNGCPGTIYVHCCGLWGDTAQLGARWRCRPETRVRLVPGMASQLTVTADPRGSPVPLAHAAIQLAAAHLRDLVVGYFAVPIVVNFLGFRPSSAGEGE